MILSPTVFDPSRFYSRNGGNAGLRDIFVDEVNKFSSSHAKKIAATMAATFNRTKRSYELQNTTYRKTGSIDLARIHSYKTSDDIFKRTAMMPNGKNHGVMLVLDWSGSIQNSAIKIAMQYLITTLFLKQVKIPFSVSIFTSGRNANDVNRELEVNTRDLYQAEIANDSYSISQLQDVFNDLVCAGMNHSMNDSPYRRWINEHYSFGGTPLIESHIASYTNAMRMKNERKIQNMSIMYITDGDGGNVRGPGHRPVSGFTDPFSGRTYICNNSSGQMSPINRMIRDAGIKIFNVYVDASLSTPGNFMRRNDDRFPDAVTYKEMLDTIETFAKDYPFKSGICNVKGMAFYNSVIFTTAACFSTISIKNDVDDEDDKLDATSSVASLKRSITQSSKWMKGAAVVGNMIVDEIVNEYAMK